MTAFHSPRAAARLARLAEAERLLRLVGHESLPPLPEIAAAAGFADATAMDRAFRRVRRTTSYEFWLRQRGARRDVA
ncbi:hypothetical protein HQQ81_09560 [Microbacteriaceae bacterium VKM Ac-2854]|nr:hypothetical protein [Microbacteriaceae bacterium VKM Ac-2854]